MKYEEIEPSYQAMIFQPEDFEAWAERLDTRVVPWVRALGNKGIWDVVRFISIRLGVVKDNLSCQDFADLVVRVCPSMKDESVSALKSSMYKGGEKYSTTDKQNYDSLSPDKWLRKYGTVIEKLFSDDFKADLIAFKETPSLTDFLVSMMEGYLNCRFNNSMCKLMKGKRYVESNIFHIQPTLCVEIFQSEQYMIDSKPTSILAYECVEGRVTPDILEKLWYHYREFYHCKLIIVSNKGFTKDVIKMAEQIHVGLCRVCEKGNIRYVLPRLLNDGSKIIRYTRALLGDEMDEGMLIYDDSCFFSSWDWLEYKGVVKAPNQLPLPYMTTEEIENKAQLVLPKLCMQDYMVYGFTTLFEKENLKFQWDELQDGVLGQLNLNTRTISISNELISKPHLGRFTLGHETGHYYLHADVFSPFISTYDDRTYLMGHQLTDNKIIGRLEYQANTFSACLLMPANYVRALADSIFTTREKVMGYIWCDSQDVNCMRCYDVVDKMAEAMNVSRIAMMYRMMNLGLLLENDSSHRLRGFLRNSR